MILRFLHQIKIQQYFQILKLLWDDVKDWKHSVLSQIQQQAHQAHHSNRGEHSATAMATASNVKNVDSSYWERPSSGRYKCNIDVPLSSSLNRTDIDICVPDSKGTFVLAKAVSFQCIFSVIVGESLEVYSGM